MVCSLDVFHRFFLKYFMFDRLRFRCSSIIVKQVLPPFLAYKGILHQYYCLQVIQPHSVFCFHLFGDHKVYLCLHIRAVQRQNEDNKLRFWHYGCTTGLTQSNSVSFSRHLSSMKRHEICLHSNAGLFLFTYYLNDSMNYSRLVLNNLSRDLKTHLILEIIFN